MEKFNQLVQFVQSLEGDFQKFYVKEQAAAGHKSTQRLERSQKIMSGNQK